MEKSKQKQKLRYILQYYFDQKTNATQACKRICEVYGDGTLTEAAAQKWFARFRCGNFDVEDAPRSGRPSIEKSDEILERIKQDPHTTTTEIAKELNINQKTVWNHLVKAGFEKKLDVWIHRDLTEKSLIQRISICETLLKRIELDPFLKRLVTGDIKWIAFENNVRKRAWTQKSEEQQVDAKTTPNRTKFLLSIWWNCEGMIHLELLPTEQNLDSELYCQQLTKIKQALDERRSELLTENDIVFYHDDSRPYVNLKSRLKLKEFKWEDLLHPPNSPDLSPTNYHLFKHLQNSLKAIELTTYENYRRFLENFFTQKQPDFYSDGLMSLPEKWLKVYNNNGEYLTE